MKKITIPKYTLGEEIVNSISHGLGIALGIVALVTTIVFAAVHKNTMGIISGSIYGASMIFMYSMSCIYHALSPRLTAKKVFRIIDHCDIYIFIAGCYTPYCLSLIGGVKGWVLFSIIWLCAIIGVLLNSINLEKFKKTSLFLYLLMGWMIIFSFDSLKVLLKTPGLVLLISGGVVYTLGAILYSIGAKKKYFHSVFHFFVLAASILQYLSILMYTM